MIAYYFFAQKLLMLILYSTTMMMLYKDRFTMQSKRKVCHMTMADVLQNSDTQPASFVNPIPPPMQLPRLRRVRAPIIAHSSQPTGQATNNVPTQSNGEGMFTIYLFVNFH